MTRLGETRSPRCGRVLESVSEERGGVLRALLCCLVESVAEGLVHLLQTKILRKNRFEQLCAMLNSMSCFPVQMKEASLELDKDSRF